MATVKNMKQLEALIMKQVQDSLITDVSKKVIQVAQEHVVEDVYDAYTPKEYKRTGKLATSFVANETASGIEIENNRYENGRNIAEIIEYGHEDSAYGYEYPAYYPGGQNFIQPRPFIENTRDEIRARNLHVEELKKSLNKKGIKTK